MSVEASRHTSAGIGPGSGVSIESASVVFELPGGENRHALKDLSITVQEGKFLVIVGPNGAGKSTVVNAIAGSVPLQAGSISIGGHDVTRCGEVERAKWIGRVFQDPRVGTAEALTIEENLTLAVTRGTRRSLFRRGVTSERRDMFRDILKAYGRGLEDRLAQPVASLSGGQRQVVSLAMAVVSEPQLLLLDEHTSALDPEMAEIVMELTSEIVRASGLTTVMVTHNMAYAQAQGDKLLLLHHGQVAGELNAGEKQAMDAGELIAWFRARIGNEISDRMLGG